MSALCSTALGWSGSGYWGFRPNCTETTGIDGATAWLIENSERGVAGFLTELRSALKDRSFRPSPVRTAQIPKAGGEVRRLGIPTVRDRVVQASLKLVLEPILEADFDSCSYGFRPQCRCQDAVEEIRLSRRARLRACLRGATSPPASTKSRVLRCSGRAATTRRSAIAFDRLAFNC